MRETYNDQYTTLTLEQLARKDNRSVLFCLQIFLFLSLSVIQQSPVAIRPSQGSLVYAALIFQGLYYVPQVRRSIARWRPQPESPDAEFVSPPTSGEGPLSAASDQFGYVLTPIQNCSFGHWWRIILIWTLL